MKNRIISRYYVTAEITLASPLSLSGGTDENTDSDVMRDGEGNLVIPGSSVAGAFRRYLGQRKNEEGIFGCSGENKIANEEIMKGAEKEDGSGRMSSLFFSDIYFEVSKENKEKDAGAAIVSGRDGVRLTGEKIVENKFDYEIIETGAQAVMRIEKVYRQENKEKGLQDNLEDIQILLNALDQGEIRLGARKNRGCGWIKVDKVYKHAFSIAGLADGEADLKKKQAERWISFCQSGDGRDEKALWNDWRRDLAQEKYIHIKIPLRLTGGISIRKYSTRPEEADFEHITIHSDRKDGIPVIPGSSWSGAIRACAGNILRELDLPCNKLAEWFGTEKNSKEEGSSAHQSMVVFGESMLDGAIALKSTRNKINRFDASTVDGALYTEKAYFGGKTTLNILVQKTQNEREYYPLLALLSLVIQEIEDGYLAIGGQTAVGRGIFKADGKDVLNTIWNKEITEEVCMKELAALKGGC